MVAGAIIPLGKFEPMTVTLVMPGCPDAGEVTGLRAIVDCACRGWRKERARKTRAQRRRRHLPTAGVRIGFVILDFISSEKHGSRGVSISTRFEKSLASAQEPTRTQRSRGSRGPKRLAPERAGRRLRQNPRSLAEPILTKG